MNDKDFTLTEEQKKARPNKGFGHERGFEGDTNVWLTPPSILEHLGDFDLDPCAAPLPRPWNIAEKHYTLSEGQDGLLLPWSGRVFCNPPYGPHVGLWMRKMISHGNGIALIFARVETNVWQRIIWPGAKGILFPDRRIAFCRPDGTPGSTAGAPSALVAFSEADAEILRRGSIGGIFTRSISRKE